MKIYALIVFTALLIAALMMHGQEAAPPSVDLFPEQKEVSPTPPPNGPELPELKQLDDSFKPKSLGQDADALKVHVLWRELKNRTVNDPDVQAARKYAQAARHRFGTTKPAPQLLRNLLSAHVCVGYDSGTQIGVASTENCPTEHIGSATCAADTRYIYAVTDTIGHACEEKTRPKEEEEENTHVVGGQEKQPGISSYGIRCI